MYAHYRGLTVKLFTVVYNRFGVYGLIGVPWLTITMEKSVYDSVQVSHAVP